MLALIRPAVEDPDYQANLNVGYVWHCHIVDHEDNEMMRNYTVGTLQTACLLTTSTYGFTSVSR